MERRAADSAAHIEDPSTRGAARTESAQRTSVVAAPPVLMYPSPKIISYRRILVRLYWPWLSNFGRAAGTAWVVVMESLDGRVDRPAKGCHLNREGRDAT